MRIFNKRNVFVLILLMLCIFTVTSVSASDLNATDDVIAVEDTVDEMSVNEKTEILSTNYTPKTFDEIQTAVDSASEGDTVILDGYYQFNNTVTVYKKLNFVGKNDATVDGDNRMGLFYISWGKEVTFKNIIFKNAYYDSYGGAINGGGEATAINCTFINNSAKDGGAISNGNAVNCTFINNSAYFGSGGAIRGGTAINCNFINNSAYGFHNSNGGAISNGNAVNCTFINNSAKEGGAISGYGYSYSAVDCIFINNSAVDYGGAVCHCSVFNSTFKFNSATTGGAIYEVSAVNCSFVNNSAKAYGGVAFKSDFLNCQLVNNSAIYDVL